MTTEKQMARLTLKYYDQIYNIHVFIIIMTDYVYKLLTKIDG